MGKLKCKGAATDAVMEYCDSPVGTGKTTAVMAHMLKIAQTHHLRHIFVVLPYTNIISQTVEVLRKAVVLDGEDPEAIVAEHHHQADFENPEYRRLATTWTAPIIVTTAVQFKDTTYCIFLLPSRRRIGNARLPRSSEGYVPRNLLKIGCWWPQAA
jgi:CRISPR-associated endonuclease/helicase Cas3